MDKITLTIDQATLTVIGQGLSELPYKLAAPVIAEISKQVQAQATTGETTSPQTSPSPAGEDSAAK